MSYTKQWTYFVVLNLFFSTILAPQSIEIKTKQKDHDVMQLQEDKSMKNNNHDSKVVEHKEPHVIKFVLDNGLTVLVRVTRTIPKVAVQMWYNVGSKDEKEGEKGIAHLIEHMIFKGTKKLSESDISLAIHKLSGTLNAFTSYDFTGYKFSMPVHNWKQVLPIIADCMTDAAFKDEHLNSEMKAVIQELKMIKDDYSRTLLFDLIKLMFMGHPYHYPLIGYKRDLWTVRGEDLQKFYKKHYLPNNATLVVVGDVQPDEVLELVKQHFGNIKANNDYKKEEFILSEDVVSRSITLYRDIKLPLITIAFKIPGTSTKINHAIDIAARALANSKSSRLHKKLVDELQLVTSVGAIGKVGMFEYDAFFIYFEPKNLEDIDTIESIIFDEIHDIATNGLKEHELVSATKKAKMAYYSKLENMEKQAYDIGRLFLATGDKEYAFNYMDFSFDQIQRDITQLFANYFRKTVVHKGMLLPLPQEEKGQWKKLQETSDALDKKILSARIRETKVEGARYAKTIQSEKPGYFDFPKAKKMTLSNGVDVLYRHNGNTPKINIVLSLKAKKHYDPEDKQGLYNFVASMLDEGTKNYTAAELTDAIDSRGMSLQIQPGVILMSMLSSDLEKGLEILEEILSRPIFKKREMEKVRHQILADIKEFWDNPLSFTSQIIKEHIYAGHPYSKNHLGTEKSVKSIKQKDLKKFYKQYISPNGATVAIVGDLSGYDLSFVLEKRFTQWEGPEVEDMEFPTLVAPKPEKMDHYIDRDQVVLCFAGLSINRYDKDYDKLLLFDQIFTGLGFSRLGKLREQSGLFYAIAGGTIAGADEQPGMTFVKTLVSLDRLEEAQEAIKKNNRYCCKRY